MKIRIIHFLLVILVGLFPTKANAQNPNWSVNATDYQFSATYTTFLNVFGNNLTNTNDKVAAFVNGEIRGVGNVVYVASADKYVAYLTVYANTTGESVNFKIYHSITDTVYNAVQTDTFKVDENVGSVFQSYAISNQNLDGRSQLNDINFKGITPILKKASRKNSNSNNNIDTFDFLLPAGTNANTLIAELNIPFNATAFINGKKQTSGETVADFTNTVVYQILSQDQKNIEEYTVNVQVAINTAITTVTLASTTASNVIPKEIDVQFSNPISGFDKNDFVLTNAVISKFTAIDSQNFKVEAIPVSEGDFSVAVKGASVVDADNQTNYGSNTLDFKNDITPPILTNLELKNFNGSEYFEMTFNEEVLNIDISDFELTGTLSDIYFVSTIQTVLPLTYRLNIFRINNNAKTGSIFLKVKSDSDITDFADNKVLLQETASYFIDNVPPVAPNLTDVFAECAVTITEIPKAQDAVSGEIIATTTDPLTYTEQGEYTINWSFIDESGNSISVPQKVSIKDSQAPQIPFLNDLRGTCSVTATPPIANDNCVGVVTATTTDPIFYDKRGNYTINWSFSDGNGNTSTTQQNVIVEDYDIPVVPVLPDIRSLTPVTLTAPQTTDACRGVITGTTSDPIFYDKVGQYVVRWVFDDGNFNVVSVDQKVFIFDNNPTAPVLPDLVGDCSVTVFEAPKANSINGEITGTTTDPLTYTEQGEFNITWNFDFGNGTILQSNQKVIVKDNFAPEPPFLNDIIAECSITITDIPTAWDFCTGQINATTIDPLTYNIKGEYTINWVFDDGNGNTSTAIQNVIVNDTTAPVPVTLPDVNAQCSINLVAPTTTDNCAGIVQGTTSDPVFYNQQGTYTVNWVFNDGNGNNTTAIQKVVINNSFSPSAPVLKDVVSECAVTITNIPEASGNNCVGKIVATTSDPLTYSNQGTYNIIWNFDYGNGTVLQSTQKVIIKDTTAPIAPILPDISGQCSVSVTNIPTTTDNCAGTITATTTDALTYTSQGNYTINWVFDDGNGNTTIIKQNIIVKDTTAPIAPTLQEVSGECSVTITDIPTTTDNCGNTITGITTSPLSYNKQGIYNVIWTFTDNIGNVATVTQKVTVKDTTAPIAPTLADISGECSVSITNIPTTTDNCAGTITATTSDALTYTSKGNYTINWVFDDGNGNKSTAIQNVIVKDTTAPIAPPLADISGQCSVSITNIPTTTDNCVGTITATTTDALTYSSQGNYTINWVFDDGNGNTSTAIQNVIVKDVTKPIIFVKSNIEIELNTLGTGVLNINDVDDNSTDNCGIASYNLSKTNFTVADLGENTIVFSVTDVAGNTRTENVKVTVTQKPLSIDSSYLDKAISIYPNPVENVIYINKQRDVNIEAYHIYNMNAKVVLKVKKPNKKFDVSRLSNGIYFIKIIAKEGFSIKKFIKK